MRPECAKLLIELRTIILISSILSIWETVPNNVLESYNILEVCHYTFGTIFVIEYILRCWAAPLQDSKVSPWKMRLNTMARPIMVIDLIVIIPFVLPALVVFDMSSLRILRLMRIMSIARFGRLSNSTKFIMSVLRKSAPELCVTLGFSFALLVIAATGIYHLEKDVQPEVFVSIPHSIWWAVNALTGIWLGDVYPTTVLGKIFASLISFIGVGTVALPAGILAGGIMDAVAESKNVGKKNYSEVICTKCNQADHIAA